MAFPYGMARVHATSGTLLCVVWALREGEDAAIRLDHPAGKVKRWGNPY
ncbi:hypothetical protein [Cypionkella sp.]|nr:hypothetical protein [Cypionkella sp.]